MSFDVDVNVNLDVDVDVDFNFDANLDVDLDIDVDLTLPYSHRLFIRRGSLPFQGEVGGGSYPLLLLVVLFVH